MAIIDLATATAAISAELGDQDTQTLTTLISVFWNTRSDKALVIPGLQFQYVLRDCCDVIEGQLWAQVTTKVADTEFDLQDKIENVQTIRSNCQTEIGVLELRARGNRPTQIGQLVQTSPALPWPKPGTRGIPPRPGIPIYPPGVPSPNDPAYGGSPVRDSGQNEEGGWY